MAAIEHWQRLASSRPPSDRPLVTLSYAQSLDGSLALRRGQPTALSGPASSRLTHTLRAENDAILIGVGTLIADDPLLTARIKGGVDPQPVILDSHLRSPTRSRLFTQNPHSAWIACLEPFDRDRASALEGIGARLLSLPADPAGQVALPPLLDCLGQLGIKRLMLEGGARVISSFLVADLVDLVVITVAPLLLGGLHVLETPVAHLDSQGLSLPRLSQVEYQRLGDDWIVVGSLQRSLP
jgi:GTP cyclohydrolase II